jgi:chemotaxis signal transduction protein
MTRTRHEASRLVVAVAGRRLAVKAGDLVEVAQVDRATWVPCRDPALLGVALHRDRPVPVVDVRRRLDLGAAGAPPWLCVFVRTAAGEVAVPVETVVGFGPASGTRPGDDGPCLDVATVVIAQGAEDAPRAAH